MIQIGTTKKNSGNVCSIGISDVFFWVPASNADVFKQIVLVKME